MTPVLVAVGSYIAKRGAIAAIPAVGQVFGARQELPGQPQREADDGDDHRQPTQGSCVEEIDQRRDPCREPLQDAGSLVLLPRGDLQDPGRSRGNHRHRHDQRDDDGAGDGDGDVAKELSRALLDEEDR